MNLPQHVLMTTDTVGGVWTWSLQWAEQLAVRGSRVTLAAWGEPPSQPLHPNIDLVGANFRLEWMEEPWSDVDEAGQWLLSVAGRVKPDVVHLNDFSHGALPFSVPKIVVAHSDVLSWWEAVIGGPATTSWGTYRRRVRAGLLGADLTVAVSGFLAASVEKHYGVDRPRVIYNARNAASYSSADKQEVIFSSGRIWDDAKNIRAVDMAASDLPWRVKIAGNPTSPDGHTAHLDNAEMLGVLSEAEMREQFASAAIYALPAKYEPFGLSVLEAALSGCALVLGDIPSLRELWSECALFVQPDNVDELRAALLALIESPNLRNELASAARERALTYNIERMTQAWSEAYAQAVTNFISGHREAPACAW